MECEKKTAQIPALPARVQVLLLETIPSAKVSIEEDEIVVSGEGYWGDGKKLIAKVGEVIDREKGGIQLKLRLSNPGFSTSYRLFHEFQWGYLRMSKNGNGSNPSYTKNLLQHWHDFRLKLFFEGILAGVVFALEELHKNFSPVVLASTVAASVTANFISRIFCGQEAVFGFHKLPVLPFHYYLHVLVLGLVVGVSGILFNSGLIKSQEFYGKLNWMPERLKPALPLICAGFLGFVLPQVLGGGARLINSLSHMHYALVVLLVIFAVKFLFTLLSYGTGVPGGIFMPLLTIGAVLGNVYGSFVAQYLHIDPIYINNFIILAMAAHFSAIVRAPITASILIMEMTGSMEQLLPLIMACVAAYVASDLLQGKPIYDVLLNRMLHKAKAVPLAAHHEYAEEKHIIEKVVCLEAPICDSQVCEVKWPENSLLVGIRRGDAELIPASHTIIYPGDYLIVMAGTAMLSYVHSSLQILTGEEIVEV